MGLIPGPGRSPGGRAWQPTPVFLPGEQPVGSQGSARDSALSTARHWPALWTQGCTWNTVGEALPLGFLDLKSTSTYSTSRNPGHVTLPPPPSHPQQKRHGTPGRRAFPQWLPKKCWACAQP